MRPNGALGGTPCIHTHTPAYQWTPPDLRVCDVAVDEAGALGHRIGLVSQRFCGHLVSARGQLDAAREAHTKLACSLKDGPAKTCGMGRGSATGLDLRPCSRDVRFP